MMNKSKYLATLIIYMGNGNQMLPRASMTVFDKPTQQHKFEKYPNT